MANTVADKSKSFDGVQSCCVAAAKIVPTPAADNYNKPEPCLVVSNAMKGRCRVANTCGKGINVRFGGRQKTYLGEDTSTVIGASCAAISPIEVHAGVNPCA